MEIRRPPFWAAVYVAITPFCEPTRARSPIVTPCLGGIQIHPGLDPFQRPIELFLIENMALAVIPEGQTPLLAIQASDWLRCRQDP
jgi:hypothetical protein